MDAAYQIILSSALIASLVSGIFNVLWASKIKKNYDIDTFRYTKLYELNIELHSLTPMNYDLNNMENLANQSAERHGKVKDIYNKVFPLIGIKYRNKPSSILNEEEILSKKLVDWLYGNKKAIAEEVSVKELLLKRQDFEKSVKDACTSSLHSMLQ
jgi:hypothetical protein